MLVPDCVGRRTIYSSGLEARGLATSVKGGLTVKLVRARHAGGMHGENLRKPARACRAGTIHWFPTGQVNSNTWGITVRSCSTTTKFSITKFSIVESGFVEMKN